MKKRNIKYPKNNKPGNSRANPFLFRLIGGGIFLCALILAGSLLSFFRPGSVRQLLTFSGNAVSAFLSESAERIRDFDPDSFTDMIQNIFSDKEEDEAPPMELSEKTGDIASLHTPFSEELSEQTYIVMLDSSMGPMLYYNQGDARWGDYLYGGFDPMSAYGCGPTAVAMLINSFSTPVTPDTMADWASANGYYARGSGSYHSLIPDSLTAFGLSVESVSDYSVANVSELLKSGHILVALMGKGILTDNGHFILITRLLEDGSVSIADPNSYENTQKRWDLSLLMDELKESYDSGGPLWAVCLPSP